MSNAKGVGTTVYCVPIAQNGVINIAVPREDLARFKEAFPEALAHTHVWLADDPVAEVHRQRKLLGG